MGTLECKICGEEVSYPADVQCRNDILSHMDSIGWKVDDSNADDEWYCPDCIVHMEVEPFHIPGVVEYLGFKILFTKELMEGGNTLLRVNTKHIEWAGANAFLIEEIPEQVETAYNNLLTTGKECIDDFYYRLDKSVSSYNAMLEMHHRRRMIDVRIVDKANVFKTQIGIIKEFFKK